MNNRLLFGSSGEDGTFTYTLYEDTENRTIDLTNDHFFKWIEGEYSFIIDDGHNRAVTITNVPIDHPYMGYSPEEVTFYWRGGNAYLTTGYEDDEGRPVYTAVCVLEGSYMPVSLTVIKSQ